MQNDETRASWLPSCLACGAAGPVVLLAGTLATPALACPTPGLIGQTFAPTLPDLLAGQSYGVTAGGDARIEACGLGFGTGHVDARPPITLQLRGAVPGLLLDLGVEGTCDTVLLVNDPLGRWSFNDDAAGRDPHLRLEAAVPGDYDIWIGTYDPTACASILTVQAIRGEAAPQAPAPAARYELMLVAEGITFDAAQAQAAAMGGHLATIASAEELQAVFAVADDPAAWTLVLGQYFVGPWLGGYREGRTWMWVTGEPWEFTAWAPGQPDNYQGRESHLNFWVRGTSPAPLLNDADPNVPLRGFVVEFPAAASAGIDPAPATPQAQGAFFAEAWHDGERVDHCLFYGRDCGQPAADRFCQVKGYLHAVDGAFSSVATDRTLVLGDGRICTIANGCGQLVDVTCVPRP